MGVVAAPETADESGEVVLEEALIAQGKGLVPHCEVSETGSSVVLLAVEAGLVVTIPGIASLVRNED